MEPRSTTPSSSRTPRSTTDGDTILYETSYKSSSRLAPGRLYAGTNDYSTTRPNTSATTRPNTAVTTRPRTGYSTLGVESQEIICAVSESRGISPTVGMAFVNLDTGEAVLSQLNDSQTYVRTTQKIGVFNPSKILLISTSAEPKSKLLSIIEDNIEDIGGEILLMRRQYWSENAGVEYIEKLAFAQDVESVKTAVSGNYYAVCCFAAALRYTELVLAKHFPPRSLRIKYEPSEGSMMIDLATIQSLELVQNLQNPRSKACLFGLLNETLTPMGGRLLRSNILQPTTDVSTLQARYDAVDELSTKEDMFFAVRQALKSFLDVDRVLTQLILLPLEADVKYVEQCINNVIMLKQFVTSVRPVFEALAGARGKMLRKIESICASANTDPVMAVIDAVINEDTLFSKKPLDQSNQRTYAVKSGVNGMLDVARQTYKESMTDAIQHIDDLAGEHGLPLQTKYDNSRTFYIRLSVDDLENRNLPGVFINVHRKNHIIECQTLDLIKRNQKVSDAHVEVLLMSDESVKTLIANVREHMFSLFRICESLAMLDMLASFAHLVAVQDYSRPSSSETLAIRAGRHPIREKVSSLKFVPNDVYATQQTRFQIITGCNMSGKSTYIRSVALMTIMAQMGSFVPAQHAAFPIIRQLFARVSMDDSIESNVSTFAAEMRETAFILRNVDASSLVIIDELGRGTSTRDGLAIALAIAEALVESRALVWFATHFRELANILSERNGVLNLHLAVDAIGEKMEMLYQIAQGSVEEEHYGIKLAKVLPLPPDVVTHAEHVSNTLEELTMQKKQHSVGIVHARRRKLLLNLKEHLIQAKESNMNDETLSQWLSDLQREFVVRMTALDEEMRKAEVGVDEEETATMRGQEEDETATSTGHEEDIGTTTGYEEESAQMTTNDEDRTEVQSSTGHSTYGSTQQRYISTKTS